MQTAAGERSPALGEAQEGASGKAGRNVPEFTVSELSGAIKKSLEDTFGYVRLRGEIGGYRGPHASGHCYFAIKDEKAKIDAVIWRGVFSRLKIAPEEGMEVVVHGKLTSYPAKSGYQIIIDTLEPAGVGALMAILEQRKAQLAAEGLFSEDRKQPIPFLPRVVGIVTSPTGAVIRDMLAGFEERFPARVVVWPVRVQGETSAGEVTAAIRGFNALPASGGPVPRPDVLIVARGGGSLEDLWGFNEESVVRAVADSRLPVISAVGHETDWTLIDLVADARAPTPTKAAEWAVPKYSELLNQLDQLGLRLRTSAARGLERLRTDLKAAERGIPRLQDVLALPRQRFDAVEQRLGRALMANTRSHGLRLARLSTRLGPRLLSGVVGVANERLSAAQARAREALLRIAGREERRFGAVSGRLSSRALQLRLMTAQERLDGLERRARLAFSGRVESDRRGLNSLSHLLASLSHVGVLKRGFALVRSADGRAVRSIEALHSGQAVRIGFHDGEVGAVVGDMAAGEQGGGRGPAQSSSGGPEASTGTSADAAPHNTSAGQAGSGGEAERRRASKVRSRGKKPEQGSLF